MLVGGKQKVAPKTPPCWPPNVPGTEIVSPVLPKHFCFWLMVQSPAPVAKQSPLVAQAMKPVPLAFVKPSQNVSSAPVAQRPSPVPASTTQLLSEQLLGSVAAPFAPAEVQVPAAAPAQTASLLQAMVESPEQTAQGQSNTPTAVQGMVAAKGAGELDTSSGIFRPDPVMLVRSSGWQS